MIKAFDRHVDDGVMLQYLGGELTSLRSGAVARHMGQCSACRGRREELLLAEADFGEYWRARKAMADAPPRPWLDLGTQLPAPEEQRGGVAVPGRVVRLARRTVARHPWTLGLVAAAVAAQVWMGGVRQRLAPPAIQPEAVSSTMPARVETPVPGLPLTAGSPARPLTKEAIRDLAGVELEAMAALHRIGADLGEPVEIRSSGAGFEVTATAMDATREREIREAFSHISGVEVRFVHPEGEAPGLQPAETAGVENSAPAMESRLNEHFGSRAARDSFCGRTLELSAALLARLHALEDLDKRFPAEVRAGFAPHQAAVLEEIRADHLRQAREQAGELQSLLNSVRGVLDAPPDAPASGATAVEAASRLDEAIGVVLGGAPTRKARAEVVAELYGSAASVRRRLEGAR